MFCSNCGTEFREGASFCYKCGAKEPAVGGENAAQVVTAQPASSNPFRVRAIHVVMMLIALVFLLAAVTNPFRKPYESKNDWCVKHGIYDPEMCDFAYALKDRDGN